ncbi:hypothetical protein ACLOJK_039233 [Asimina triloba]
MLALMLICLLVSMPDIRKIKTIAVEFGGEQKRCHWSRRSYHRCARCCGSLSWRAVAGSEEDTAKPRSHWSYDGDAASVDGDRLRTSSSFF